MANFNKNSLQLLEQDIIKEFISNAISFQLTKETAGFYKCNARNSIGSIEKIVQVKFFSKY